MKDHVIITKNGERLLVARPGYSGGVAGGFRAALVPDDLDPSLLSGLSCPSVVSYGMGRAASLTLSSLRAESAVAEVRRDLPVLGGGAVPRQTLRVPPGLPDEVLLKTGIALLTGNNPD